MSRGSNAFPMPGRPPDGGCAPCSPAGRQAAEDASLRLHRPADLSALKALVADISMTGETLIAAGGRGPPAEAAVRSPGGHAVSLAAFDDALADPQARLGLAGAGAAVEDVNRALWAHGLLLAAVPPPARTLGGAIAAGDLAVAPAWIDLLLPGGEVRRVAPDRDAEIYRATLGGCGLTGVVVRAGLPAVRARGDRASLIERRLNALDEALEALETAHAEGGAGTVWLDAGARGRALGRGILRRATPLAGWSRSPPAPPARGSRAIEGPFDPPPPPGPLNPFAWRRVSAGGSAREVPLTALLRAPSASPPARRRPLRFVCSLPPARAGAGVSMLLRHLAVSRRASANPVLSRLERPGRGLLEPPDGHVALACEIARHPRAEGLFAVLERTVLAHDGRVTLTSDIAPTRAGFERTYPEARRFAEVRRALDPQGVLSSELACRLGLDRF